MTIKKNRKKINIGKYVIELANIYDYSRAVPCNQLIVFNC